ncbi:peptidylprolyl isomerase [Gaetbulibacter aestuarii]|uniref:Peptidylprolyl isomerase n=1 Tax=Gaetbulibacter aestuarii TaxID=1502358 RepID=A0ABW7MYU0_9FLAO
MKFITNLKYLTFLGLLLVNVHLSVAQEIIEDEPTPSDSTVVETTKMKDSTAAYQARKVDGVAAVVGDYIVLDSDVNRAFRQLEAQGVNTKEITRCQLFGKLLEDKLYAHQAVQDSIVVSDAEIRSKVDYQIEQFLQQVDGSMERLLKLYGKEDEKSLRDEMFEINKSNELSAKEQENIIKDLEITPEEVRIFFNKIPKDQRPTFGTELKVAQIVAIPKISEEEKQRVINRLKEFKEDIVENGASFRSKAVLYSEDPGSASRGGRYTLNKKQPRMAKEFRQVAFSMQEGEVSDPFETEFGYHILKVDKIRGQEYDVSHILLIPKPSQKEIDEARERLEKIRKRIVDGDISFADAAREASDEKETRADGGQLINPQTQDYNFELTRMDTELYTQIQNLKDGEVSQIFTEQDRTGKPKFKILMVTGRIDEHKADFARDYLKIKDLALEEKKLKTIEEWQKEKINDTYIKINGDYRNCEFSSNWLKK